MRIQAFPCVYTNMKINFSFVSVSELYYRNADHSNHIQTSINIKNFFVVVATHLNLNEKIQYDINVYFSPHT